MRNFIVKKILFVLMLLVAFPLFGKVYSLSNDKIGVTISDEGNLVSLRNIITGTEYASGGYLWRIYYDTIDKKENEIIGGFQKAKVSQVGNSIFIDYDNLYNGQNYINVNLRLIVILENDKLRFSAKISNHEPHTAIRELQYPLVHKMKLPQGHKLITTEFGGKIYDDPLNCIKTSGFYGYMAPDQTFRQLRAKYPSGMSMNCFIFAGKDQGLYFGSHDLKFQDTWHGLRVYKDDKEQFSILEGGFYKYPNCLNGDEWECNANVIAPYSGDWHVASRIYRKWADTWFDHRESPEWIKKMTSWQRLIFKHQYGETIFKYSDLNGRIKDAGHSAGCNTVLAFAWWMQGHDNSYPDYTEDLSQGGDAGWSEAITQFKEDGDKLLMYYNGKLIDMVSDFYRTGEGSKVSYHTNTGSEYIEQYRFSGNGTWLREYDAHSFVVADNGNPIWRRKLIELTERAMRCGANGVFFDQLGYAENNTNWDLSREFPIPNLRIIYDKGQSLKAIRTRIEELDPSREFAIGTEWLTDYTSQYCDFIHACPENNGTNSFLQFFRYTFPEIIISDRGIRDDNNIERRVNHTVLRGLRNDIEVYRCRGLITETPHYQEYLAKVNEIKHKYANQLMAGRYNDVLGFKLSDERIEASSFLSDDAIAIVLTNARDESSEITTTVSVPGYYYVNSSVTGKGKVSENGTRVSLSKNDLVVLLFSKKK